MPSFTYAATAGLSLYFGLAAILTVPEAANAHSTHQQRSSLGHSRRRHHARLAQTKRAFENTTTHEHDKRATLVAGTGMGTLYFDINGGGTCGPVNGWSSYAETNGYAMCEPNTGYKTLAQRGSNRVVAMPSNMLAGNLAKYCGKEVVVTYGDNTVENLVIWDGCASCNSNNGLDFSSTVFAEVFGESKCGAGRISGMSWKITSNQLWSYPDGNPINGAGEGNNNEEVEAPAPAPAPSSSSSSSSMSSSSSQAWSSSSSWVSSSSNNGQNKPTSTTVAPVATPTQGTGNSSDDGGDDQCDAADDDAEDCDDSDDGSSSVAPVDKASTPPVLIVQPSSTATSSSISASETAVPEPADTTSSDAAEATGDSSDAAPAPAPSSTETPAQPAVPAQPAAPASGDSSDGGVCNDVPGQWRCVGRAMQQCVQNPGDWTWMTRVNCNVDIINCDTPNPVCASY